jgi:DNA-binding FadR family transcriptional regulator
MPPPQLTDRLRRHFGKHTDELDKPLGTERDLAQIMGVSRSAIRMALAQLEEEGLIWRRQGKGTFLAPTGISFVPSVERLSGRTNFFEVMEARLHLEPILVQLATTRATIDQIAMIERMAQRTAHPPSGMTDREVELWDGAFHRSIAEAAGNRLLLDIFELVETIRKDESWAVYRGKARTPATAKVAARQHVEISSAIASRSPVKAADLMRDHIRALQQRLAGAMELELEKSKVES